MNLQDWISGTRAADIMTREMITVGPQDTMAEVADQLLAKKITGAPVVNDGCCIGVLSFNDLVAAEEKVTSDRVEFSQTGFWDAGLSMPVDVYENQLTAIRARIAPLSQQPVERFMSSNVVSVQTDDTLGHIVQQMTRQRIHRVIVLDDQRKLVGLISTLDVLTALAQAAALREPTNNQGLAGESPE